MSLPSGVNRPAKLAPLGHSSDKTPGESQSIRSEDFFLDQKRIETSVTESVQPEPVELTPASMGKLPSDINSSALEESDPVELEPQCVVAGNVHDTSEISPKAAAPLTLSDQRVLAPASLITGSSSPAAPRRKRFLVIGATGTIGSAVCSELLSLGHDVVGMARSHFLWESRLVEWKESWAKTRREAAVPAVPSQAAWVAPLFVSLDLNSVARVKGSVKMLKEGGRGGPFDGVVFATGRIVPGESDARTIDGHDLIFSTNFLGPATLLRTLHSQQCLSDTCRVVILASDRYNVGSLKTVSLEEGKCLSHVSGGPRAQYYESCRLLWVLYCLGWEEAHCMAGKSLNFCHPGPVNSASCDLTFTSSRGVPIVAAGKEVTHLLLNGSWNGISRKFIQKLKPQKWGKIVTLSKDRDRASVMQFVEAWCERECFLPSPTRPLISRKSAKTFDVFGSLGDANSADAASPKRHSAGVTGTKFEMEEESEDTPAHPDKATSPQLILGPMPQTNRSKKNNEEDRL